MTDLNQIKKAIKHGLKAAKKATSDREKKAAAAIFIEMLKDCHNEETTKKLLLLASRELSHRRWGFRRKLFRHGRNKTKSFDEGAWRHFSHAAVNLQCQDELIECLHNMKYQCPEEFKGWKEWALARLFFKNNPDAVKFRRANKKNKTKHSYYKSTDPYTGKQKIFRGAEKRKLKRGEKNPRILGAGSYGTVRPVNDEIPVVDVGGREYVIKVCNVSPLDTILEREASINVDMGLQVGHVTECASPSQKKTGSKLEATGKKAYSFLRKLGNNLESYLKICQKSKQTLESKSACDIAMAAGLELHKLHIGEASKKAAKFAHRDVKLENMLFVNDSDRKRISLVDFQFAVNDPDRKANAEDASGTACFLPYQDFFGLYTYKQLDLIAFKRALFLDDCYSSLNKKLCYPMNQLSLFNGVSEEIKVRLREKFSTSGLNNPDKSISCRCKGSCNYACDQRTSSTAYLQSNLSPKAREMQESVLDVIANVACIKENISFKTIQDYSDEKKRALVILSLTEHYQQYQKLLSDDEHCRALIALEKFDRELVVTDNLCKVMKSEDPKAAVAAIMTKAIQENMERYQVLPMNDGHWFRQAVLAAMRAGLNDDPIFWSELLFCENHKIVAAILKLQDRQLKDPKKQYLTGDMVKALVCSADYRQHAETICRMLNVDTSLLKDSSLEQCQAVVNLCNIDFSLVAQENIEKIGISTGKDLNQLCEDYGSCVKVLDMLAQNNALIRDHRTEVLNAKDAALETIRLLIKAGLQAAMKETKGFTKRVAINTLNRDLQQVTSIDAAKQLLFQAIEITTYKVLAKKKGHFGRAFYMGARKYFLCAGALLDCAKECQDIAQREEVVGSGVIEAGEYYRKKGITYFTRAPLKEFDCNLKIGQSQTLSRYE